MRVSFFCPLCKQPTRLSLAKSTDWQCRACDHRIHLEPADPTLSACPICENHELYKKKDFPHTLGMAILLAACVLSFFTYGFYEKWLTWALLIGTALFDGLLYLWVGDAIVCYRCDSHYRGFQPNDSHKPFELTIGERYRQERIRREHLRN